MLHLRHSLSVRILLHSLSLGVLFTFSHLRLVAQEALVITLPATGELVRTYATGNISVRLVSRPFFGSTLTSSPVIEVGSASLTFMRDKTGAAIVMLGDTPLNLPLSISIGEDGRSADPLDFTFSYDRPRGMAKLLLAGKSFSVASTSSAGPVNIIVMAGDEQTWKLETFEVQAEPIDGSDNGGTEDDNARIVPRTVKPGVLAAERAKAFEESLELFKAGDFAGAENVLLKPNRWRPGTVGWQLESAGQLTNVALILRQQYDYRRSMAVAQRAREILRETDKEELKAGARDRSQAHEMAGYIAEEILREEDLARSDYERALQIRPQSARARTGLERLDEAKAKVARLETKAKK